MRVLMVSHGYPPIVSGVTLVVQKIHDETHTFDHYEALYRQILSEKGGHR
jgi:hypothetical protein